MAAKLKDTEAFAVAIALTKSQATAIRTAVETEDDRAAVEQAANTLVRAFAEGGMMVPEDILGQIEKIAGRIDSPTMLVPLIEKAMQYHEGRIILQAELDPVHVAGLENIAGMQVNPMGVQEFAQRIFNDMLRQGVPYSVTSTTPYLPFSEDDLDRLQELTGQTNVTGQDVMDLIERLLSPTAEPVAAL